MRTTMPAIGMNGISPSKKYTLTNLPSRGEMYGTEILAYYYVTWARVFPDNLKMIGLTYDKAYEKAMSMSDEEFVKLMKTKLAEKGVK